MFFLAILSAARCEQFYQGCTQNYKDVLGILRSHSIKDFLFWSPSFCFIPGNRYITGKSFGGISFDSGYNFFPAWKLETWNSFCITANTGNRVYKTFINGKAIKTSLFSQKPWRLFSLFFRRCSHWLTTRVLIGRKKEIFSSWMPSLKTVALAILWRQDTVSQQHLYSKK